MANTKDLSDFIVTQLTAVGVHITNPYAARADIKAFCFRGHDNKTPSLSIRRMDGAFYCFGCGVKGKNWNSLKAYLNVDEVSEQDLPDPFLMLSEHMKRQLQEAATEIQLPWDLDNWEGAWRQISPHTLNAVHASRWFDDIFRCHRILFPIKMYGEVRGWAARRLDGKKKTPWFNAPHMSAQDALFPLDLVRKMKKGTVALVEGPHDALRLVNYNIPALAILGCNNYSEDNRVHLLNAGVERVVITMDSDPAGEKARYNIAPSLREMFEVEHFLCPEGKDPGNMPKKELQRLHRTVRG